MCVCADVNVRTRFENLITHHGFTHANTITHLGLRIDAFLTNLNDNWVTKIAKMKNLANCFSQFSPSILCKLDICLMFFFSQLSYLGTVIAPSPTIIEEIQKIVVKFIFPSRMGLVFKQTIVPINVILHRFDEYNELQP